MFAHNKRLQHTVRISDSNPGLASRMLERFDDPRGKLAAACRDLAQALGEPGTRGPWNQGKLWRLVSGCERQRTVDGSGSGSGTAASGAPARPLAP